MHKIIERISSIKYLALGFIGLIHKLLSTFFFCLLNKCALQSCIAVGLIHSVVNTVLLAKNKIDWRKFIFPLRNINFSSYLPWGNRHKCSFTGNEFSQWVEKNICNLSKEICENYQKFLLMYYLYNSSTIDLPYKCNWYDISTTLIPRHL